MKTKITCTAIVLLLILLIPAGKILWSRPEPTAPGTTASTFGWVVRETRIG